MKLPILTTSITLVLLGSLFSCSNSVTPVDAPNDASTTDEIPLYIGVWEASEVTVGINESGVRVSDINTTRDTWAEDFEMKPYILDIKEDGSYVSTFFDLEDSVICQFTGYWSVKGDLMTIHQISPFKDTLQSRILELDENTMKLESKIAWGKNFGKGMIKDDDYTVIQRRIGIDR